MNSLLAIPLVVLGFLLLRELGVWRNPKPSNGDGE